jgi:hypothetical protein
VVCDKDIEFNRYGGLRKAPRLVQHLMTRVALLRSTLTALADAPRIV